MKIKLSDFKIIPVIDSIKRIDMSDEEYFSDKYREYISNSRLKWINPEDGGSPEKYKNPPAFNTSSLKIGSAVHTCLLQPESFTLAPKMHKPNAKLGDVVELVYNFKNDGMPIEDAIRKASLEVGYFVNTIDSRIPSIIEKGTPFWEALDTPRSKKEGVEEIFLSDDAHDKVEACLQSCYENKTLMDKLHPKDMFGVPIESYNEIALFINFLVTYKDTQCTTLKFKMKADNYTVDPIAKEIVLNDLKTTSKPVAWFMNPEYGSMQHYRYYRQMYLYMWVLSLYCQIHYGASKETGWTSQANMLVVQTSGECASRCYNVNSSWLKKGKGESELLLKMIAAYKIFGWNTEIEFA